MANLATRGTWDPFAGLTDIMRFDPFKELGIPFQRYFDRDVASFVPRFEVKENKDSNKLIEEFMLLANTTVAKKIQSSFPQTALLRRHAPPPTPLRAPEFLRRGVLPRLGLLLRALCPGQRVPSPCALPSQEAR